MKLKRLVSMVAAVAIVAASSTAFAATFRHSKKNQVVIPDRSSKGDYYYEDFTGVEPGNLPTGVTGGSNSNGYFTTEVTDIGKGINKNCFLLVDESHATGVGSTPYSTINLKNYKGKVGIEVRFKYVPTSSESKWSSFVMALYSPEGMFHRTVCASANGTLGFNYGGNDSQSLTMGAIGHDTWYTLNTVVDFDEQLMNAQFRDEGNSKTKMLEDVMFYENKTFDGLSKIDFRSSEYGGKWYVDYVRVYKVGDDFEFPEYEDMSANAIKKGSAEPAKVPAPINDAIAGRTNINIDGKYKFTTKAPKVSGSEVLVTAKNVASFFNLAYSITDKGEVIKGDDVEFVVAKDGSGIKNGSSATKLSAKCVADSNQVFIPIGDIAKELGYTYTYDSASNTAVITK